MAKIVTHVVTRTFQTNGSDLLVGDAVDASQWKNTAKLVETGFMRPVTDADRVARKTRVAKPAPPSAPPAKPSFKLKLKKG